MADKSLIFIPDLSGFTKFVTETEIKHSNHIISELIEVILNANKLNLQVSEIEGDAVLYYRLGEPPTLNELIEQTKIMFIEFHAFLKTIERDNVCQCGACQSASYLTLKFIAHFGEIQEVAIQNFTKLMGSDLILAHRLLKVNIDSHEYLLCTDDYLKYRSDDKDLEDWVKFEKHVENYENFGDVEIGYVSLLELHKQVPKLEEILKKNEDFSSPHLSIEINAPIKLVHNTLIDHELKKEWVPGLTDIKIDDAINRINSAHTCEFDNLEVRIVTVKNQTKNKTIRYTESVEVQPGLNIVNDYELSEINGNTLLSLRLFPRKIDKSKLSWFQKIIRAIKIRLIILVSKKNSKKGLIEFKKYCEKLASGKKESVSN